MITVVVTLQIAEEEAIRKAHVSASIRICRFLLCFMVLIMVALAAEGTVTTVKAVRENPALLLHAASLLLAGCDLLIRFNRYVEVLESEVTQQARQENRKLE